MLQLARYMGIETAYSTDINSECPCCNSLAIWVLKPVMMPLLNSLKSCNSLTIWVLKHFSSVRHSLNSFSVATRSLYGY